MANGSNKNLGRRTFKLTVKLALLVAFFTIASTFLSGSKVAAIDGCPADFQYAQNNLNWGVNTGGHTGDMGGLIIHAYDAENGQNLITNYTLNSGVPNAAGNYREPYPGTTPNGTSVDLNDRIFQDYNGLPAGWENDPSNRTHEYRSSTQRSIFGGCNGWDAYGPADFSYRGNGHVLDCGPTESPSRFWFTGISNPLNDTGGNGANGYWSINVYDHHGNSVRSIAHYTEGSMSFDNGFGVSNGFNKFVNLVWHPIQPQPPQPVFQYGCTQVHVESPHVNQYRFYVTLSGTDHDNAPQIGGGDTPYDSSDDIYGYASEVQNGKDVVDTGNYKPIKQFIHIESHPQHWDGSKWVATGTVTSWDYHCYHAACGTNIAADQAIIVKGDGPGNIVLAGHAFTVYVPVKNDNTAAAASTIPSSAGGKNFSLTEPPDDYAGGLRAHNTDFDLNPGEIRTLAISFTANSNTNQVRNLTLTFYPDMYGSEGLGSNCSVTFPIYQRFDASLSASSDLKPTIEHPYKGDDYKTDITVKNGLSHAVHIPTSSAFYKLTGGVTRADIDSNTGGTYPSSPAGKTTSTLDGHLDIPLGSYRAGDEYCATISASYTTGYVGPDNNVKYGSEPASSTSCPRIANEPYFKVYDGDISAGGSFGQCTSDGGTLAGYADVSDPPGATRGSSTELSALALIKITGVASAQRASDITGSPVKLSFANSGVQVDNTGNESPTLGGQFGGCRTLTDVTAPPSATNNVGSTFAIPGKNGAYKHTGNLTINGGTLAANRNVAMFVDGDVYIASNISYGNSWQAGSAPSFILRATGNIYVAGGVTRLAGVYIAHDKPDGSGGKIYTCASTTDHFSPMPTTNLYDGCNNQLIVTGNFVAKQVNLMRTFGSLRDEEPTPGTPPTAGTNGALAPLYYTSAGIVVGNRDNCVNIAPNRGGDRDWRDNYLCPSAADTTPKLAFSDKPDDMRRAGLTNCTDDWGEVLHDVGYNNFRDWRRLQLCSNLPVSFGTNVIEPGKYCTLIFEPSAPDFPLLMHVCIATRAAGSPGTPPTPKGPPFIDCSNRGSQLDTISCAGELFEYGPTLFLSNPAVNPPGGGSLQFQSITSLPPVL